jgi:hypothetical protein
MRKRKESQSSKKDSRMTRINLAEDPGSLLGTIVKASLKHRKIKQGQKAKEDENILI